MKRYCFVLIAIVISISVIGQNEEERNWVIYPTLGVDLGGALPFPFSDIPDDFGGTPKPFPLLGIGFDYNLTEKWQAAIEVNYHLIAFSATADVISQPVYFADGSSVYFSGHTETDVELRMVEFPLVFTYNYKARKSLLFGAYYSRILEGEFSTKGEDGVMSPDKTITDNAVLPGVATTTYSFDDDLDAFDYGVFIGYRFNYNGKLFFNTRLHVGFKSIFQPEFNTIDYEMYQMRLSLGLSYKLFG